MKKYFAILLVVVVMFASQIACNSESWEAAGGGHINGGGLSDAYDSWLK
jgi:hypothetical protein